MAVGALCNTRHAGKGVGSRLGVKGGTKLRQEEFRGQRVIHCRRVPAALLRTAAHVCIERGGRKQARGDTRTKRHNIPTWIQLITGAGGLGGRRAPLQKEGGDTSHKTVEVPRRLAFG